MQISVCAHPLLDATVVQIEVDGAIGAVATSSALEHALAPNAVAPWARPPNLALDVRGLLRHGGYKPSGRGKPASEYLATAHAAGTFPRINALVDAANATSLHSGLPISLLDAAALRGATRIEILAPDSTYVFNPSGQTIDASGLLAFCDEAGAAGTPVKDAQRTKTHAGSTALLAVIWGTNLHRGYTAQTAAYLCELLASFKTGLHWRAAALVVA